MDVRRQQLLAVGLGLLVAVGYGVWRWDLGLVWDDTSVACLVAEAPSGAITWTGRLHEAFSSVQSGGYRPLSSLVARLGAEAALQCRSAGRLPLRGCVIANALLFGLLACLHLCIAREFVRSRVAAVFATFLLLCSTPILTAGLVMYAGVQAVVPVCVCAGLLCHSAIRSAETRPWQQAAAWLGLSGLMILGPWYREFTGLIGVLILVREWLCSTAVHRENAVAPNVFPAGDVRQAVLTILCLAGFLHALYPTALARLVYPELPLAPVFRLGALGTVVKPLPDHISPGTVIRGIQALHWRIFADLISVLPPTSVLIAVAGCVVHVRNRTRATSPDDRFLGLWFALTFLPFLKAFKIQVHLAYCLVPLSILIALNVERLWSLLSSRRLRIMVLGGLAIAIADHGLNPWIVHGATRAVTAGIDRRAKSQSQDLPEGSAVLCNALQIQDIAFAANNSFQVWSLRGGTPHREDAVRSVPELRTRLETWPGAVAVLDVRVPQLYGQMGIDRKHYVVQEGLVEIQDLRQVDRLSFRYPVLDPLKLLTPVQTTPWPGPPDLEFDFYRGPSLEGTPWLREVAVEYWQGRIRGTRVRDWQPDPVLVDEIDGFSVVLLGDRYYGIPISEGAFSQEKFRQNDYGIQMEAASREALASMIARFRQQSAKNPESAR